MLKRGMIGFYAEMQIINWYSVEGGFTLSSEFILYYSQKDLGTQSEAYM